MLVENGDYNDDLTSCLALGVDFAYYYSNNSTECIECSLYDVSQCLVNSNYCYQSEDG
jgi:hypothetical protein